MKEAHNTKPDQCCRCKKFFDYNEEYKKNKGGLCIYESLSGVGEWQLDLCSECQRSLRDWLGG